MILRIELALGLGDRCIYYILTKSSDRHRRDGADRHLHVPATWLLRKLAGYLLLSLDQISQKHY
jgi:hypothetical protein